MLWPRQGDWPRQAWPPQSEQAPGWQQPWPYQQPGVRPQRAQPCPWAPAPKPRHAPVVLVVLLAALVWLVAAIGLPGFVAYLVLNHHEPYPGRSNSTSGLTSVPADISSLRFKPTAQDKAFFRAVGFNGGKDMLITKWTRPLVHVWIAEPALPSDRHALTRIVAMVNKADEGRPRFVVGNADVEIRITFQRHAAFVAGQKWGEKAAGVCLFDYRVPSFALSSAQIRIDDALSRTSGERQATLYHEFGHAIGLTDTSAGRWSDTIMFHETGGPASYTRLDLAVIRMLYDPRVIPGETRAAALATWRPR